MKTLLILTALLASTVLIAQNDSISAEHLQIAKQIKLFLFSQMYFGQLNEIEFQSYIDKELEVLLLRSSGFKDVEFYYIPHQSVIEYKTNDGTTRIENMPLDHSVPKKIIVARTITSGRLYIVSGVNGNTFGYVISHLDSYVDPSNGCNYRRSKKKKYECLFIEGVDIKHYLK